MLLGGAGIETQELEVQNQTSYPHVYADFRSKVRKTRVYVQHVFISIYIYEQYVFISI